jgi:hypothetical protein
MAWIPALATVAFTGIGYSLTAWAIASRSPAMASATEPALLPAE